MSVVAVASRSGEPGLAGSAAVPAGLGPASVIVTLAELPAWLSPEVVARMTAELAAETASLEAAGGLVVPDDLRDADDPDGPGWLSEEDLYDELPSPSR